MVEDERPCKCAILGGSATEARRKDTRTLKQIAARLELEPPKSPLSDEAASEPETGEQQQARYDRQFVEFFQRQEAQQQTQQQQI